MVKRILSIFLAFVMLFAILPVSAWAADGITYSLPDNGALTISGSGPMKDYEIGYAPWYGYREDIQRVLIEDGVTSIGGYAFSNFTSLTRVTMPDTITAIGDYAFSDCAGLPTVTIPDSVTTIGIDAFRDCACLTIVAIPDSVTTIGAGAFRGCASLCDVYYGGSEEQWSAIHIGSNNEELTSATIHCNSNGTTWTLSDEGVLTISGSGPMENYTYANTPWFDSWYDITSVMIEDGVTSIGDYAFARCCNLTSVTIPDSVTTIGDNAFDGCNSLTDVTIGSSVTRIDAMAFLDCTSLTGIWVDENNPNYSSDISGVLFNKDKTELIKAPGGISGDYTIPDSVTTIGDSAFDDCDSLTSVTIPDSVITIGDDAFYRCTGLTSVTIPDSVTIIGDNAFYYCTSLAGVTIPDSVTIIGNEAFHSCTSLTRVVIGNSVTTIGRYAFYDCTSLTSVTIPGSVTTIGDCAFADCTGLTGVTISDSVTTIGGGAFSGCIGLTSVTIPAGVTDLSSGAFNGCTSLTGIWVDENNPNYISDSFGVLFNKSKTELIQVPGGIVGDYTIPDSITAINDDTFRNCAGLTGVTIPDGITTIGFYAFSECDSLTSVTIPDSVTAIDLGAFSYCDNLASVTIPDSVTLIDDDTFRGCTSLTHVRIPDSVTCIDDEAFLGCTSLISVTIPDSVTTIGRYAFLGCTSLTSVTVGNSVTTIEALAFGECTSLAGIWVDENNPNYSSDSAGVLFNKDKSELLQVPKRVSGDYTIPDSITTIDHRAFEKCINLTSVTIPDSVTTIGEQVFNGCTNLTSVTIPDSITAIGNYTFSNCPKLISVTIPDSVITIGYYTFWNCANLTSVTMGDSVTTIGAGVFEGCNSLTSVTIPDSVTAIGNWAFLGCSSLTDVYYGGDEAQWDGINMGSSNEMLTSATIHYNHNGMTWTLSDDGVLTISGIGRIKEDVPWDSQRHSIERVIIEDGITAIGDGAFHDCTNLTSVAIPHSVTSIGEYAFRNCTSLISVTAGSGNRVLSLTVENAGPTMGDDGFSLTGATVASAARTIGAYAFDHCVNLTRVTIGNRIAAIGEYAFRGCEKLASVTIPESVTTVGNSAFEDCTDLTVVNYLGNEEQWNAIHFGAENDSLTEADIHYVYRYRLSGKGRCETAYLAANELKAALGVEKFDAVIIASGDNFADALAGSYLAAVKGAPILLHRNGYADDNAAYIAENLAVGGKVYILGGTAAVPEEMETALAGYDVERIKGANRFETNLEILKEAGVGDKDILVATGYNFADSLSASATGMPILLVHNSNTDLTETQKAFLDELDGNNIVVIGGTGAVSDDLFDALGAYGYAERVKGSGREATSVEIAKKYFDAPEAAVVAYSRNFPDGLCGGPLAYAMGAPLLLTNTGYESITAAYTTDCGIDSGFVLGGTAAVSDAIVRTVFAMEADAEITVKR